MHKDEKVIPITRGKPSRLFLSVRSNATGIDFQLHRIATGPDGLASSRPSLSLRQPAATVLEFKPQLQKGTEVNRYEIAEDNRVHAVADTQTGGAVFASE